jgi:peptidyl-prolyl cis-trans isomerase C
VVAKKPIFDRRSGFFAFCVLVLFGVVVALQVRRPAPAPPGRQAAGNWSAEEQKSLAMRLEDRNLNGAAADAWSRYIQMNDLDPAAAAAIHYRIGKLQQAAEQYQAAIASFYQAEAMLGQNKGDLGHEINVRVRDCFVKLGQYDDLGRDMTERTAPSTDKPAGLAGQQVVAEIGPEKITVADFDRLIQQEIELAIKAAPGLSPEQVDEARKHLLQQLGTPQARARKLQELVAVKVLARKARADGLDKSPDFRKRLMEMSDMLLANRLLGDEITKRATTTIDDYKRYYEANKAQYVQPGQATIAHIVCPTEEQAADLIKKIAGGAKFEELAEKHSLEQATRSKGGMIDQPVSESGRRVPGIGENADLHAAIFKAKPGTVLDKPYKAPGGYHIVKVIERVEPQQLTLDQAADRVRADTQRARTQEVTEQYLQSMFDEAKVKLYPEVFAPATTAPEATSRPTAARKPGTAGVGKE